MSKKNKIVFILVSALVTLTVPLYIVFTSEALSDAGPQHEYKFQMEPVDPYDFMRGRYINLNFSASSEVELADSKNDMQRGQPIYVTVKKDSSGFAYFDKAYKNPPKGNAWFETTVSYQRNYANIETGIVPHPKIEITIPFDRYYMNEDRAPQAEYVYGNRDPESRVTMYAVIIIKDGRHMIKQIYVDNEPLNKYLDHTRGDYEKEMSRRKKENERH